MTPLERRYRRLLRLLPSAYRQAWEEDMVGTYMEVAETGRVSLGERLSVVALAVRLRLAGSPTTSPRGMVWRQAAHALALMALLYQALAATASVAFTVGLAVASTVDEHWRALHPGSVFPQFSVWSDCFSLLWVATFGAVAVGRVAAARTLAVLALAAHVGVTVAVYAIVTGQGAPGPGFSLGDAIRWGWAVLSVAAAFIVATPDRRLWLPGYFAGALMLLVVAPRFFTDRYPLWTHYGDLENLVRVALVVAMAVGLAAGASRRSPRWLLALAVFGGGIATVHLVRRSTLVPAFDGDPEPTSPYLRVFTSLDLVLLSCAVVCALVGLAALRRLSRAPVDQSAT